MLQELLNLGLVNIGSDDSRFGKMKSASKACVEAMKKDPSMLVSATLVAFDKDADENELIFSRVEKLVLAEWKTMRNTHTNRPRELLRSVIIDALATTIEGNPDAAGVVWHTAVSPYNHHQVRLAKEADLLLGLLRRAADLTEHEAITRASMGEQTGKRTPKKSEDQGSYKLQSYSELKDDDVYIDVARSAGPSNPQGTTMSNPNPNWPHSGQTWANEFSPRMAQTLSKAINLGLSRLWKAVTSNMQQHQEAVSSQISDVRTMLTEARKASKMRLDVLWWFEAKYSPSLKCGYRELLGPNVALAMAFDLAQLVPPLAPASVTYLLGEAAAAVSQSNSLTDRQTLEELLSTLANHRGSPMKLPLQRPNREGRVPLTDLVVEAWRGTPVGVDDVQRRAGLDPALELTTQELAMWVFRDLQAQRLVEGLK